MSENKVSVGTFYKWENFVPNEPLDLVSVQLWVGITEIDKCKVCLGGPYASTYEISLEWGDTKNYEYISEVCSKCLCFLNNELIRNKSEKYSNIY
jgi:hypothetical protein